MLMEQMICPICMRDITEDDWPCKSLDNSVCPECENMHLIHGVLLIDTSNGDYLVLPYETVEVIIEKGVPDNRIIETPSHILEVLRGSSAYMLQKEDREGS